MQTVYMIYICVFGVCVFVSLVIHFGAENCDKLRRKGISVNSNFVAAILFHIFADLTPELRKLHLRWLIVLVSHWGIFIFGMMFNFMVGAWLIF